MQHDCPLIPETVRENNYFLSGRYQAGKTKEQQLSLVCFYSPEVM